MQMKRDISFLYLEDGSVYRGWSFFNTFRSTGEVVFNTGMTGYQEIITDPSYYNQILLFTYPEIGNTGVNLTDIESDRSCIKGLICKNICIQSSNWRSKSSLVSYLIQYRIPHIFGVDTRYITKIIRSKGAMIGCISSQRLISIELLSIIRSFKSSYLSRMVNDITTRRNYQWSPDLPTLSTYIFDKKKQLPVNPLKVVVIDYGVKFNILNRLFSHGCSVQVVSFDTSYEKIIALKPDGILLSNGPGDPASIEKQKISIIQKLISLNIPVFGICLGHQLLSLAAGTNTYKLSFGHRGLNHPSGLHDTVKVTSQNHGYVIYNTQGSNSLLQVSGYNLNDGTISIVAHKIKPAFSVQYHPEASPGSHDSDFLFEHFIKVMTLCKLMTS
uniref:Carbamoyl phosphate synthase small chain n=1 Tax=Porolithon onkodes TaxID=231751 RepID=A0A2Z2L5H1_9FLOR|nr:carbamoyl-phosphate synthase small chain [Porolithon onkodes]ASB29640.1 carbamoyl-phosphate synthase small chain [Porolithon onkodes]